MEAQNSLFVPLTLGGGSITLKHRVVLAPLTRQRANEPDMAPRDMNVEYYKQRSSDGGLLISEATNISMESCGYHHAPGIWSEAQVRGWRRVTDAVHEKGGYIFCQLWHVGRVAHPSWKEHPLLKAAPKGTPMPAVSASSVGINGKTFNIYPEGNIDQNATPRALETSEIPRLIADYRHAAKCAVQAGFDGVELHSAHGYLLDQFLRSGTNLRTDMYGGSPENRCRLLLEILSVLVEEVGPGRVGVRLSPTQPGSAAFFGAKDDNDMDANGFHITYGYAVRQLNKLPLAYLFFTEPRWSGGKYDGDVENDPGFNMPITNSSTYRKLYKGVLMAAGGFTPTAAKDAVKVGTCDLIAFGRLFIANPDLPERIRVDANFNSYMRKTFYSYSEDGYVDYPDMNNTVGIAGKYSIVSSGMFGQAAKAPPAAKL